MTTPAAPLSQTENSQPHAKPLWLRLAPLLVVLAAAVAAWQGGLFELFSFDTLKENRAWLEGQVQRNYLITALIFILVYTAVAGFPVAIWMSLTGGFLFGPWFGALFSVIGATAGATIWFIAVKTAFGDILRKKAGGFIGRLAEGFNDNAFSYLLTLRLIPAVPFSVVNIAASLLNMRLASFVVATFIGIIPGSLVYNSIGNGISGLIERGEAPNLGTIFEPQYLLPLVGLGLLSLAPVIYKKFKKSSQPV